MNVHIVVLCLLINTISTIITSHNSLGDTNVTCTKIQNINNNPVYRTFNPVYKPFIHVLTSKTHYQVPGMTSS